MPGLTVCDGATCMCALGDAPGILSVTSQEVVTINGTPVATIMDFDPIANITPFGTCATLTAAALGVPTPCVPATSSPWMPGSIVQTVNDLPVLTIPATLECDIGGMIMIVEPVNTIEVSD
ncbi:hypothetical protein Pan216_32810 [Planctomycetes bacterium Pan216]|uniref:DUF4280 domain-containing protein n=1 Tax=Kolteria novifilia TaxID=2527975 RepID=A0A518B605_9BACT|nr:hypothetical protein Pan216_32810 [Planctomycetes bacterium Pan216]